MWYLDAMGTVATLKQCAFIRQQIWVLFNRWMGRTVLKAESEDLSLRVYAHCTLVDGAEDGTVMMAFINLNAGKTGLRYDTHALGKLHYDFILTPKDGKLDSKDVLLNGKVLELTKHQKLPELGGVMSHHNPILVP